MPFLFFSFQGGEERTIEFMEREGRASSKTPLLEHSSERGTVKHPFPMNFFLKPWKLGQWFYQVIKIGIVQYVCCSFTYFLLIVVILQFLSSVLNKIKFKLFFP
jgi:hypothetical protein